MMRMEHNQHQHRRAVTLLEVILALGILGFVFSMTYWFYSSTLDTRRESELRNRKTQLVRVLLDRMAEELRQVSFEAIEGTAGMRGTPEELWLYTRRLPGRKVAEQYLYEEDYEPPGEYDLLTVHYRIVRHPEVQHPEGWDYPLGLARVEKRAPYIPVEDQDTIIVEQEIPVEGEGEGEAASEAELEDGTVIEGGAGADQVQTIEDIDWQELYSPEILYLRLCYFDGYRWWDTWEVDGENPLPQLVQITVGLEPRAPYGESFGYDPEVEEFCTCQNEDTDDCEPLDGDLHQRVVRLSQADIFFRSRVTREAQGLLEEVAADAGGAAGEGGG